MLRSFSGRKALVLVAGLSSAVSLLVGCASTPETKTYRVCDNSGCRDVGSHSPQVFAESQTDSESTVDPDVWQGESIQELQTLADSKDVQAIYKLGQAYSAGVGGANKSSQKAADYYQKAASTGHPWAQYQLSEMYHSGNGVTKDLSKSLEFAFAAAKGGVAAAAYNAAMMYSTGKGVPQNQTEAAKWLEKASSAGLPDAQFALGMMKLRGTGVEQQLYPGLTLLRKAASGGNINAQTAVGRIYLTGLDTMGQDLKEARTWLDSAAQQGDKEAKELIPKLEEAEKKEAAFQNRLAWYQDRTRYYLYSAAYWYRLHPPHGEFYRY